MICDIGGFAASCYKRGIGFVHIPTTLLAMADAAIGGKTGVNFLSFKNQIGSFQHPNAVVIYTPFLETLPQRELRAGYAEVLKHYLIQDKQAWEAVAASPHLPSDWTDIVPHAMKIKLDFTEKDPLEKNIRKALNFGHTIGHAVESHFLHWQSEASLLHGEAVAMGMMCEAFISLQRKLISQEEFEAIRNTLNSVFDRVEFSAAELPEISQWCTHDKKNAAGKINATLLNGIGDYTLDQWLSLDEIEHSLLSYQHRFKHS
jgi:3-dehydroquinate synthase